MTAKQAAFYRFCELFLEAADWALFSSICDDSNLHVSIFK